MNKFENVYQDAALMRKVLLGEANEVEQQDLEKRLAECPDLQKVYGQLQSAAKDSAFQHLAIEVDGSDTGTEWCEAVSDADYNDLP